ncbi:hypothetical protein Q8A67_006964 [Cirrhinus molitorella]|uniref:Uncharacterized protein n=1 Tax=Cirrhinus molitorella TaxID=172907 RepID=A0AA88Q591_9TELE|nr:hypothetical protein Q8A67_006964 [Cirrhinus molitorella]
MKPLVEELGRRGNQVVVVIPEEDEIASHVLQKKTSMVEIMSRAALWFMHFDFAFELPRPLMPNMILIGGMDNKKAEPLSQDKASARGANSKVLADFQDKLLIHTTSDSC